jgi:Chaperone of endosialidase
MNRSTPIKATVFLLAFVCFLLPRTICAADGGLGNGNTAEGNNALNSLTTGTANTAMGDSALLSNTSGFANTATGFEALERNTTGFNNTATGVQALFVNNGHDNTANGFNTLLRNTGGSQDTAVGSLALFNNSTGNGNTAIGYIALQNNTTGKENTATGGDALHRNTTGIDNTATGFAALQDNTTGHFNTATGSRALFTNNGNFNTANGYAALQKNVGDDNVAVGANALSNSKFVSSSTAVGEGALANSLNSGNIGLGIFAGGNITTGSDNIDIGNSGVAGDSGTIRFGDIQKLTFIAGIYNTNEGGTIKPVYINSNGQLGTQPPASSARFKDHIKPMDKTSEAILGLKPVTFHYKSDNNAIPQFGLIAEDVANVNPDLVVRDDNGEIYTVRYDAVNAMLLNEFLKEHQKVEEQAVTISQMKKQMDALTAGLERVIARFEAVNSPLVVNDD